MTYTIMLEQGPSGSWAALAPDLPGLLLSADTREALLERAPGAIADHIDALRSEGLPVPTPSAHELAHIEVAA